MPCPWLYADVLGLRGCAAYLRHRLSKLHCLGVCIQVILKSVQVSSTSPALYWTDEITELTANATIVTMLAGALSKPFHHTPVWTLAMMASTCSAHE